MNKKSTINSVFAYSTIGIQLAATVTLFIFGGYELDEYKNSSPVFTTIGAFLGMAIGFYHLIKQLQDIERREKNRERKKQP